MSVASDALVAAEDLKVHFSTAHRRETVRAVDGVSLRVAGGETFGVIGETGSGKSTLGRALVGLVKPTAGRVLHAGSDLSRLSRRAFARHRRDYQIIFQDATAALDPRMAIGRSVREPLDIEASLPQADRDGRVRELLADVGLAPEFAERLPHELSGGQNQRATIARALALKPKMIVCDEVVAALDVSIQADILNLLARLQQAHRLTYVFITHDLGVAAHVSDRIAVMYLGKLVEVAGARQLMAAPLHPYSMALLSAEPVPTATGAKSRRIRLEGEVPSAIDPPSGCRFRLRCWLATGRCAAEEPALRDLGDGRMVACHFADSAPRPDQGTEPRAAAPPAPARRAEAALAGAYRTPLGSAVI